MAKLDKPHVMGRVQPQERAAEVIPFCEDHGWYATIEVAPHKPEDLSDIDRQLRPSP